ncbi:ATP-binding protein [Exiguobacterium profundum]|uniref:HAMP domain-containing sensor histidine kinase n=1 Tax=Exiguobacterium TaxID=33986 RepID=UPI000ABF06B1|nr:MULTISPECIES: ATP-binding protein [Exiguobacterium]QPI68920.1 HAMP domain-containing protein [Exiguobacterium sp. PBE]MBG0917210.1 HAMP domain-containing protein [Exiguobacterium sp. SRB7LM]MBQ6458438.1 HAMP domain-containing protein [Exiguobacterium sp.]MCT4799476.1 ATP-binding protein [Exiguobacterium profundum]MDT0191749.1 ATP-binding protein [Exiguobacterium sp. BG5(2022)]
MMIRRNSIVTKLWLTILVLVSVILFIVSVLMLEFFNSFHIDQERGHLAKLGGQVQSVLLNEGDTSQTIDQIIEVYGANYILENGTTRSNFGNQVDGLMVELERQDWETYQAVGETAIGNFSSFDDQAALAYRTTFSLSTGQYTLYLLEPLDAISSANAGARTIILWTVASAIIVTTVFAFFLSTRITAPLRAMRDAVNKTGEGQFDLRLETKTRDEIGELAASFNAMSSQLSKYVNALDRERLQLASILRSMADGVITLDRHANVIVTNPQASPLLQDGQPHEVVLSLYEEVMEGTSEKTIEVKQDERYYTLTVTPLVGEDDFEGAVVVIRDTSESHRLDKMRTDFVANISHELRTPLVTLQGYSEAIIDGITESDEATKEFASIIYDESLRLARLVNDLLDLARIESGKETMHFTSFDIGDFLPRVMRKFNQMASEKEIRLQTDAPHRLIEADGDRLEQVFTNLIGNAIAHTDSGEIRIEATEETDGLRIQLTDTGHGIPKEDLPFVFERFYKADKARTSGSKTGTGIGLAIVKNVVDAHHGKVSVSSTLGVGTTFEIYLPFEQPHNS